jgi:hypothetical protein
LVGLKVLRFPPEGFPLVGRLLEYWRLGLLGLGA